MEESKAKEGPKPGVVGSNTYPKKDTPKPPMKKMMGTFNSLEIWGYNS